MSSPAFNPPAPIRDPILPDVHLYGDYCPLNPDTENPVHEFVMKNVFPNLPPINIPPPDSPKPPHFGPHPSPIFPPLPELPPPLFPIQPFAPPLPLQIQEERCKHCDLRMVNAVRLPEDPKITEIASPLLPDSPSSKEEPQSIPTVSQSTQTEESPDKSDSEVKSDKED